MWWQVISTKLSLSDWTHIAVTWNHVAANVFLYANGRMVGSRSFTPGTKFYKPTGNPYKIANDGHWNDHQFYGYVMDLYVFGTALSRDELAKVRGKEAVMILSHAHLETIKEFLLVSLYVMFHKHLILITIHVIY